jgi:hypothetical protein
LKRPLGSDKGLPSELALELPEAMELVGALVALVVPLGKITNSPDGPETIVGASLHAKCMLTLWPPWNGIVMLPTNVHVPTSVESALVLDDELAETTPPTANVGKNTKEIIAIAKINASKRFSELF